MLLIDIVQPDINIPRSINLERDKNSLSVINDYQLTNKTLEVFSRFTEALQGEKVSAWSLTGPYGMGKSSYCNFLLSITGSKNDSNTKVAHKALKSTDPNLYRNFKAGLNQISAQRGFFRIFVTSGYESINQSLARGLQEALDSEKGSNEALSLSANLSRLRQEKNIHSQELMDLFKRVMQIQQQPLIIILDEFGKNLDYLSHHPKQGDIFILQQLAETESVFLWVVLHQAFDEYATGLSSVQRKEWSKVQGRFEDISFVESTTQMLYLIQGTLKRQLSKVHRQRVEKWAIQAIEKLNLPTDYKKMFDLESVTNIYPFHPLTALALIELCKKFAQNDRTLLAFISSGDPLALPALLKRLPWPEEDEQAIPIVGLDYLYDYFLGITGSTFNNRPESQRWLEIDSIIQQAKDVSRIETTILKSIGVLNLLSNNLGVKANADTIADIIEDSQNVTRFEVLEAINTLVAKGALIYREYAGEYRLWEGSDFDVAEAVNEQKGKMATFPISQLLQEHLPLSPLVASRHAYTSGTVRRFERRWLLDEQINEDLLPQKGFDGLIVYTFGTETELINIPEKCADNRPLLISYVPNYTTLQELALEVAAVRAVFYGSPELNHDGVARREVKYRVKTSEQFFREYLQQIFSPGAEELQWYSRGKKLEIRSNKGLSSHISNLCDQTYNKCPIIGNEMISYENLSSAATRARRELVEAMAIKSNEPQFGLSGYGPEIAIYRTLLAAAQLHTEHDQNGWQLKLDESDPRLKSLWQEINLMIHNSGDEGCTIQDLLNHLQEPPFGMRMGPLPIYICLYILVKSEEIIIFREGSYLPYLSIAEISLLIKRPDLFILKQALAEPWERAIFSIYQELFQNRRLRENVNLRNRNMLGVVGPLIKLLNELPNYTKNTRRISHEALLVRTAILNSVDPRLLIMEELPRALGMLTPKEAHQDITWQIELKERLRKVIEELEHAYPQLIITIQQTLLDAFAAKEINHLMAELKVKVKGLYEFCDEIELKTLMKAILREGNDAEEWSRGIAGIVIKKPTQSWGDDDLAIFSIKIREHAKRIEQLHDLAALHGLALRDRQLVSILKPDGTSRRFTMPLDKQIEPELNQILRELTSYPREKIEALVGFLLDHLDRGENDAG